MRIWDVPIDCLCRNHLLGEHRELHAIWNILIKKKKGFSKHPETLRWRGKLKALYLKHEAIVREMKKRGYQHRSSLNKKLAKGKAQQYEFWQSKEAQKIILKRKCRQCGV
ncbi:MAG: pyrimidine dimer DNA glycosylase/endonuclease V [Patescibacteria group bacterium]|nr:pyrimidine dimer DNA glycosylase/endonuclease V [Patescibacteria group bacterium]